MHIDSGWIHSEGIGRCLGPVGGVNGRGWGGAADAVGRGGSSLLGLEGEGLDGPCPDIANADDVIPAGGLDGVAMADDPSGGDTCRVDGGVMYGVDR